jgi:tetratricopeptide (TPR) repeat protein
MQLRFFRWKIFLIGVGCFLQIEVTHVTGVYAEEVFPVDVQKPKTAKHKPAKAAKHKVKIGSDSKTDEISQAAKRNTEHAQHNAEASAEYHFSLAQAYASDGNPDRAIEEYKLTLLFDPNSALVQTRLATEFVKKGMLSAAMDMCKEAIKLDPKYLDAHLILAGLYSTSHETQAAVAEYDTVLKYDPKHEEAIVYKSQTLVEDGQIENGAAVLRYFVKKNPDSALALYYLGRAEQQLDHFKEAVSAFQSAMEQKPGFSQAGLALGYLYEDKQMNAQAVKVYREIFDESQDPAAASRLSTIYLKEEKYRQAIPFLEVVQAADPDDMNVQVKLGLVHMELKQYDKAIQTFRKILEKNPDSDRIHYYLGSLYEEASRPEDAIAELKAIRPESRLYADAALHAAYLLKQANRAPAAKEYIKTVIEKGQKTPSLYLFAASLEEEAKNFPGAIQLLKKGVAEFPEDEKIRYFLGSLYDRQGDVDQGLMQMEAILKINPENVDALNYIGYTWTQRGVRLNDAEKYLKRAIRLRPENGYIQDSWGWYLFTCGRVQEAVKELEKAARLKPNESTILEHLGDAYRKSNLPAKALVQYADAVKYAEDEESKKKIMIKVENLRRDQTDTKERSLEQHSEARP